MTEEQEKFEVTDRRFQAQTPDREFLPAKSVGPMEIMMVAVQRGAGKEELEILRGMFELQKEADAETARKAYFKAKSEFNKVAANMPPLKRDKFNRAFGSWYTSLENMLNTYRPVLAEFGLSPSFPSPKQDEKNMTGFCRITHEQGYHEDFEITVPIDQAAIGKQSGQRSRNAIQDIKSTFTYVRAVTFEAALGIAGTEGTQDDDGNSAGGQEYISEDQAKTIKDAISEIYPDKGKAFFKWLGVESVETIPTEYYKKAIKGLNEARRALEKRKGSREQGQEG